MPSSRGRPRIDLNSTHLSQQTLIWEKVVTGLATLQDAIQTLSGAYMKHTNAVLGDHAPAEGIDSTLTKLADNPALLGDLQRQPSPARSTGGDAPAEKKERKKRQHDPNAPKRPLTPFFLYMQTARQIIANDLGPEVPKGAVSSEGTRRWSTMAPDDKQVCTPPYSVEMLLTYSSSGPMHIKTTFACIMLECTLTGTATQMPRT